MGPMTDTIRILGIDPGLRHTGWGIVERTGSRLSHIDHGVIKPDAKAALAQRLAHIYRSVEDLLDQFRPDAAGVEETFVNAGPQSALKLGQARGAAMAAIACFGTPVAEFAPRRIKLAVVGTGAAEKDQVAFMVGRLLPKAGKMTSDSADALACAICTAHHLPSDLIRRGAA